MPPGGPGGFNPTPPPPKKKRSKLPLVLAAVVFVLIVGAGIAAALLVFGGSDGEAEDREAFGVAAEAGDAEEIRTLAEERPELLDTTETVVVGEPTELTVSEDGYVVADLALDSDTAHTVELEGPGDPALVVLDGDREEVATEPRLESSASGTYTVVIGGTGTTTLTVVAVQVGTVDLSQEQVTELDTPGQIVELALDVSAAEQYEASIVDGPGYSGRILDAAGTEVVAVPADGSWVRFSPEADATFTLVLEAPDGSDATSVTTDVLSLARWTAYSGEEGDDFYLEEQIEPTEILPLNDPDRDAITWCIDLIDGTKITFEIQPSLDASVWELRSYPSEEARQSDDSTNTYDDIVEGNTITIEADGDDATFCYEMRLISTGESSVDLVVTDETE